MSKWRRGSVRGLWTYPFGERSWADIRSFLGGMTATYPDFQYMINIIDSVVDSGADELLAGSTSMHDLMVVPRPIGAHIREMIAIRAPGSIGSVPAGQMRIEHLSSTGLNDSVDRPPSEAVALFWRFVIEKYGIRPPHRST